LDLWSYQKLVSMLSVVFILGHFYYDPVCCSGVRPFGVSLLIAGYDDNGPQLYQVWTEIQNRLILPLVIVHCSTDDIIFYLIFQ